ncbi:MAG TPA: flavin reductase [Armatimonadetes bacterium]|nr:flavin reductase [Armatimonadota bacterium]
MARTEEAFRKFTYGVYVVGAKDKGRVNALTCAWVMRVSFSPPMVAVAVGKTRYTHDMIKNSGAFSVNVLAEDQVELGRHFGLKSGREVDKFANIPYREGRTGSPIIEGVSAWLDCRLVHAYDAGDHTIFVGEVVDAGVSEKKALVFDPRDYWG